MLQHNQHSESHKREEVWAAATGEVIAIATQRYAQLARLLGLGSHAAGIFVSAVMEATRQYQTGYMYANYERRTGYPYPDEGRENEERVWAATWTTELARLESALAAERR
jgi:cystathionine beta-lyase family protein involved in aluminum resistance